MNFQDVLSALLEKLPNGFLFTPQLLDFVGKLVAVFETGSVSQDAQRGMVENLAVHLSRLSQTPQPQAQPATAQ